MTQATKPFGLDTHPTHKRRAGIIDEYCNTYYEKVFAIAFNYFKNKPDARDAAQEVFYKVVKEGEAKFKALEKPGEYIFIIARNHCIDELKKRNKSQIAGEILGNEIVLDLTTEDQIIKNEELAEAHRRITQLPRIQQEVIRLRMEEGKTHKEVAEILHITETNSSTLFSRALKKISDQELKIK